MTEPSPDKRGLTQEEKEEIDSGLKEFLLWGDVGNSLVEIMPSSVVALENINPIQTYEEYLQSQNPGAYAEYAISKSDPALVKEWDGKIRAFNADLERIKTAKDNQAVRDFFKEMTALLRTKVLSEKDKAVIDATFAELTLDGDVTNSLRLPATLAKMGEFKGIEPIETYEQYLQRKAARYGDSAKAYYNYVMQKSDPARIQEYNGRIRVFNENNLEQMKSARDAKGIQDFCDEMMKFLKEPRGNK